MVHHYDWSLVLTSLLISVLASWLALEFSARVHEKKGGTSKWSWLAAGSLVMGSGIWAMHYIGMLAYKVNVRVAYHWPTVLLSFIAAVLASTTALYLVTRRTVTWLSSLTGGLVMGAGIASMHYIGMAAMRMPCGIEYNSGFVWLSVFLAIAISLAAIRICYSCRTDIEMWTPRRIGASLLMGAAIPTMHYVGMAAVHMQEMTAVQVPVSYAATVEVSTVSTIGIAVGVVLLLCTALLFTFVDRRFTTFRSQMKKKEDDHELLSAYQQRLMSAYRRQGVGCWSCDPATMLFHVDSSLRSMYDMEDDGKPVPRAEWLNRVHPEDLHLLSERWNQSLMMSGDYDNEYRLVHRDGTIRHCRTVAVISRDSDGKAIHIEGMTWDITLERLQQKEAEDQAERFYMTLEAVGEGVLSVDQNQTFCTQIRERAN